MQKNRLTTSILTLLLLKITSSTYAASNTEEMIINGIKYDVLTVNKSDFDNASLQPSQSFPPKIYPQKGKIVENTGVIINNVNNSVTDRFLTLAGGYGYSTNNESISNNTFIYSIDSNLHNVQLIGAYSEGDNYNIPAVASGTIIFNNSTSNSDLIGAYSSSLYGTEKKIIPTDGTITLSNNSSARNIYGSYVTKDFWFAPSDDIRNSIFDTSEITNSDALISSKNTISIKDSTIQGIYGSYFDLNTSYEGRPVYNVYLNSENTINLDGNIQFKPINDNDETFLFASNYIKTQPFRLNIFNNNTLNMRSSPFQINKMGNFENYNFSINNFNSGIVNKDDQSLITVSNQLKNDITITESGTTYNKSNYKLAGISGTYTPNDNDYIHLIRVNSGGNIDNGNGNLKISELFNEKESHQIDVGLVRTTRVSYKVDDETQTITAYFDSMVNPTDPTDPTDPRPPVDPDRGEKNLKPAAESNLAALMNITRTSDAVAEDIFPRIKKLPNRDYAPFVIFKGSDDKYNSGSHIKSTSYRGLVGGNYQYNDTTLGAFLSLGEGDYNTYNEFGQFNTKGTGHVRHYGVGIIAKYMPEPNNYYAISSLQFGRSKNDYNNKDIITGSGNYASYTSEANYFSAHLDTGYIYKINLKNNLNTSLKYLVTHLGNDEFIVDGDTVQLKSLMSNRLQLKEQWSHQYNNKLGLTAAIGYEHEFSAKSKVHAHGYDLKDTPSLTGGTGIAELGVNYNPFNIENYQLIDFRLKGYTGKRDGFAATINLKYTF